MPPGTPHLLRKASLADRPAITALIAESARQLGAIDYPAAVIEGALRGAFGVDTQLILDGTYFVIEDTAGGRLVACGGWSRRRTLFGGDAHAQRDAAALDPSRDAARIRAFFVASSHARQGLGRALLDRCETEAEAEGFSRFQLMATLPGVRLYNACGYSADAPGLSEHHPVGDGLTIEFVPMHKHSKEAAR